MTSDDSRDVTHVRDDGGSSVSISMEEAIDDDTHVLCFVPSASNSPESMNVSNERNTST